MNIKQIKELARIVSEEKLSVLEIADSDLKIRIERETAPRAAAPVFSDAPAAPVYRPSDAAAAEKPVDFNNLVEVQSPMVGVFYAASAPDAAPYVTVGSKVKKGDTLCIIEAMKLLNEINAEVDGEIADICVENGQVVEFGQTLFKISR